MTPRERILKTLKGEKADQVPWFGDLDYWATSLIAQGKRPADFKASDDYIEWHRRLGVGFYLQGYFPFQEIIQGCEVKEWKEGELRYRRIRTPQGTLEECWKWSELTYSEAPIVRLVKTVADLPAYRYLFENMRYEPDYDFARQARPAGRRDGRGALLPAAHPLHADGGHRLRHREHRDDVRRRPGGLHRDLPGPGGQRGPLQPAGRREPRRDPDDAGEPVRRDGGPAFLRAVPARLPVPLVAGRSSPPASSPASTWTAP